MATLIFALGLKTGGMVCLNPQTRSISFPIIKTASHIIIFLNLFGEEKVIVLITSLPSPSGGPFNCLDYFVLW